MKKYLIASAFLFGFLCFIPHSFAAYQYYRPITVTANTTIASGTQSNFPMLVSSTISTWENTGRGGHIQNLCIAPNGGQEPCDLVFATSTANCGTANLNFETESYTSSTGALVDWVNVPTMAAGTTIYACYDNSAITTDQSHPSLTWNSNYKGVFHFPNGSSLGLGDSTANNVSCTNLVSMGAGTGKIDGGITGNNSNGQGVDCGSSNFTMGLSDWSVSGWVNENISGDGDGAIVAKSVAGGASGIYSLILDTGEGWDAGIQFDPNGSNQIVVGSATDIRGGWHYLAGTWKRSGYETLYVDGVYNASADISAYSGTNMNSTAHALIGAFNDFSGNSPIGNYSLNGTLDEVHVANTTLSPSWILTEYNNQANPATFYSMGGETGSAGPPAVLSGYLDSQTFDTGSVNGAQLNSVLWHGFMPTGAGVGFQFAVSNASNGPWNFTGPDGVWNSASSYWIANTPSLSIPLINSSIPTVGYNLYNNFRYFRYRVTLFSDPAQTVSPRVDDVVVNWSP